MMKKLFVLVLVQAVLLGILCCKSKNELKECRGKLWELTDTTLVASVNEARIQFEARDLRLEGETLIPGDSVHIYYIGSLAGDCKALLASPVITVRTVEAGYDPKRELLTAPPKSTAVEE